MNGEAAVQRINRGLGFRLAGNALEGTILDSLKEAQRDLEKGKTLPRFLLVEDYSFTLEAGQQSVPFPPGFIRESDDTRIRIVSGQHGLTKPIFLDRRYFIDAVEAYRDITTTSRPRVYVLRPSIISFIQASDLTYIMYMDYYKAADVITLGTENAWLANGPGSDWLIGEAGWRLAMDMVLPDAVQKFDALRKSGRQSLYVEDIVAELASGPLQMGANN